MNVQDLRQFYIDGQWQSPVVTNDFNVENPSNEQIIATISLGTKTDVDKAVVAAQNAFTTYAMTTIEERISLLENLLKVYMRRYDEMAEAISKEMGAPIDFAKSDQADTGRGHIQSAIDALKTYEFEHQVANATIIHEPIGVCGLITPWNWPINQIACKVAPALATGCTIILKPSEVAPISAHIFAEMIDEAGFPPGVFNLINGDGAGVGSAMSSHPDIDMISFTGSTRAGRLISNAASVNIKRVALELGGKSPNIIFADSDVDRAVKRGVYLCMENSGQSCNAPTRMLIEESVYQQAVNTAVQYCEQIKISDSSEAGDHIGPLVTKAHWDKVQGMIQDAIDEGAELATGGLGKPDGKELGHFCKPTIFKNVHNKMTIAQEEVFGPVLVLIPFKDEANAIAIANDSPYGLAAHVHSNDLAKAKRVAQKVRAGMVRINGAPHLYSSPFGGYKQSGNGREWGQFGFEDYLEIKALSQ